MADRESPRVALLARPGEACEKLRAALREAGGEIVIEADPASIDPQALRIAAVETVLVALDPAVEDALEKFDDVLGDRAIEVIFDEADLAARREGWDAARWVRHLAAKLHRHDDVLPPGREPDSDPLPRPGRPEKPEDRHADADIASFVAEAGDVAAQVPREPSIGEADTLEFPAVELGEIDMPAMELAAVDMAAADMPAVDMPAIEGFEAVATSAPASTSFGSLSFTDDINDLDFEGEAISVDVPTPAYREAPQDFDALLRDLGTSADSDAVAIEAPVELPPAREFAPKEALPSMGFDIAPIDAPASKPAERPLPSFANLSLEALSDLPASGPATQRATDAPVEVQYQKHLSELEQRIASLAIVGSGTGTHGAVLILAGIGGPDAVRQILTALPAGFPRAVLISQRLDGGRYDRLVQQMARAATLPVHLAEAGKPVQAGYVYIVPPDIGIDGGHGLQFAQGFSLLDALPADDSAVLLLSGADASVVDAALAHAARGALVAGQSPEGCYDAAAPMALTARGGTAGAPHELVQSLLQRWPA